MDLNQLKGDLSPIIITNSDLSFSVSRPSLTECYRRQLKVIAESVDVSINAILGMLTTDQIKEVIKQHKHIGWSEPHTNGIMFLDGITRETNGTWCLCFDDRFYTLHDLDIQECLSLLATCENVMLP
jgi:hypothetical protein